MSTSFRGATALATAVAFATSLLLATPATAADEVTNQVPPTVTGTAQLGKTLTAQPGSWTPADATFSYEWFRAGQKVAGETAPTIALDSSYDVGKTFTVRVTATKDAASATVESAPSAAVARGTIKNTVRPKVSGTAKFRNKLTATGGSWSPKFVKVSYRWLRNDKPIVGATQRTYTLGPSDVGAKIRVRVTATRTAYEPEQATSVATKTVAHLRGVRKVVTYSVRTKGTITASLSTFKKYAAETYADPRGWRGMGVQFKRVSSGGDFTLVLSQASKVPSFSSACSSTYSCRVGRYVVINQTRWQNATPAWDAKKGSLRNYRHMVVNHETGHWFGRGHASCGGKGQLAPVMQQQSKGLAGCKINPWPKTSELHAPRYGF